jgi:hypothetical protein
MTFLTGDFVKVQKPEASSLGHQYVFLQTRSDCVLCDLGVLVCVCRGHVIIAETTQTPRPAATRCPDQPHRLLQPHLLPL